MLSIRLSHHQSAQPANAQQAPCDIGVTELIETLSHFCDADFDATHMHLEKQETEALAALLIHQLCVNLNGKILTRYLSFLRGADAWTITDLPRLEFKPLQHPITLPQYFPDQISLPLFLNGDRVRWLPLPDETQTDGGIVIGCFFAYARHRKGWGWKYVIWLEHARRGILTDTAWEEDLQILMEDQSL